MSIDKIQMSRDSFSRRLNSIGVQEALTYQKSLNNYETLKQNRRKVMGKVFRNTSNDVEFFSLRDHNAKQKSAHIPYTNDNQLFSFTDLIMQEQQEQLQTSIIECSKCQANLSKVIVQQTHQQELPLKKPIIEQTVQRNSQRQLEQIHLSPHHPINRTNLPPILFQAHIKEPTGFHQQSKSVSSLKEAHSIPGRIQFGRIAEGIDEDYLEFIVKQRLLQQAKLKPQNSKKNYSLKKVNLFKSKTGGNVLGKAFSKMKVNDAYDDQKKLEKQLIREKERQIDELIFSKKINEEYMEMKDFL